MPYKILSLFITAVLVILITQTAFSQETPAPGQQESYIIGSGDLLEIVTWKEPDFSREEIIVRLDGKITFPLLDDVIAAGKTPIDLKLEIQSKLEEFVADPHVTVTVRSQSSKRFYILGEVANTGEHPLNKDLTVLQAFARAGGFTEWASKKEILLFRRVDGKDEIVRINYKKILKGEDFEQNVKIMPDDTIIVP